MTSITCSKSKTPAQLAHDIHRRMVGDARKLRAVLLHRRRDDMNKVEAAQRMALELVAASGGYMEIIDRHDPYNSNSEISLYMNRGSGGPYFSAKVSQYNDSVSFERFQLPHELAKQVVGVIADYLKTKGTTE